MVKRHRTQTHPLSAEFKKNVKDEYTVSSRSIAYRSRHRLVTAIKNKRGYKAKKWLHSLNACTLHALFTCHTHLRPTITSAPGVQLQVDLIDVRFHSQHKHMVSSHFY